MNHLKDKKSTGIIVEAVYPFDGEAMNKRTQQEKETKEINEIDNPKVNIHRNSYFNSIFREIDPDLRIEKLQKIATRMKKNLGRQLFKVVT